MRSVLRHLILVGIVGFLVVSCGDDTGAQLRSLERDPLASIEPVGATSVGASSSGGSTGGCLRMKPSPTTLSRTFEMEGGTVDTGVEELADAARSAGWDLEASTLGYRGEKEIDGRLAQVAIDGFESADDARVTLDLRISNPGS